MKTLQAEVKSARKSKEGKREVVSTITYPEYESLTEAIHALSEGTCLKLVNAQVATNEKNRARAEAVGTPTEKALQQEAFQRLLSTTEGTQRLASVTGDTVRFTALIADTIKLLKEEKGIKDDEEADAEPASA